MKDNLNESKNKKTNKIKIIVIAFLIIIIGLFTFKMVKEFVKNNILLKTSLIINNEDVTSKLQNKIIIKDDIVYISKEDIANYIDEYIYEDRETNKVIMTSSKKVAIVGFDNNNITINGLNYDIGVSAIKENEIVYLPISKLEDVYNIEVEYTKRTNAITIDSLDKKQIKATVSKNTNVKESEKFLSDSVDKIKKGDSVIVISESNEDNLIKIRTENGKIGYIKEDILTDYRIIREDVVVDREETEKIDMFWDYYSEYKTAPDRTGESYEGVNVVSPAFFYINKNGEFKEKIGTAGQSYIEWAKSNGYKIWPFISNAEAGIKVTSSILNNLEKRQELIENIVNACVTYKLDGINMDFEYMYLADKDMYSRLIIELAPRLKAIDVILSIDLTAPYGSENWSLCYDRNVLGKVADYLIYMGYDQYGSNEIGSTAGYDWIKASIKAFIKDFDVDPQKLILAIPFYTRIWTITPDGKTTSKVVSIKNIDSVLPEDVEKVWNNELKQYIVEYKDGNNTKKMWIEDERSISEKIKLIRKYNLAGVSAWNKDREQESIWKFIKDELNK